VINLFCILVQLLRVGSGLRIDPLRLLAVPEMTYKVSSETLNLCLINLVQLTGLFEMFELTE